MRDETTVATGIIIVLLLLGVWAWAGKVQAQTSYRSKDTVQGFPVQPPPPPANDPRLPLIPLLPPVEYDHFYQGDLTIKMVRTVPELERFCGKLTPSALACAIRHPKACLIVMVDDEVMRAKGWNTGMLLRHELGHCNGWGQGQEHPGQRSVPQNTTLWAPESERRF